MTISLPTVGRIVHYVSHGSADGVYPSVCRAAIVTEIPPGESTYVNSCEGFQAATGPDVSLAQASVPA